MTPGPTSTALRPARLGAALAAVYLYRWLAAALLALPLVTAVGASGIRGLPRGDARLFEPGGLLLLEVAVRIRESLGESLGPTALALLGLGFAGLVPERWLIGALGPSGPAPRALRRLTGLALATWGARALLGLLTLGLALTARSYFASARDERTVWLAVAVVAGGGLVLQLVVSFWHDLAAVAVVAGGASLHDAVLGALGLARVAGGGLAARFAAAQLLGVLAWLGAAVAVGALDVARGDDWRSAGAFASHQLAVLASLGSRAAWLWSARRASARAR